MYVTNSFSNTVSVISTTSFIQSPSNNNANVMIHDGFGGVEAQVAMEDTAIMPQQQQVMDTTTTTATTDGTLESVITTKYF